MLKKRPSLQLKYTVITAFYFVIITSAALWFFSCRQTRRFESEILKRYEAVFHIEQTSNTYFNNTVMPKLYDYGDAFVKEAIISKILIYRAFEEFQKNTFRYSFRQPAIKPLNPKHTATESEKEILSRFQADSNLKKLSGYTVINEERVYYIAKPILMETACLACHGSPEHVHEEVVKKYGNENGFNWAVGSVVSASIFTAPVSELDLSHKRSNKIIIAIFILNTIVFIAIVIIFFNLLVSRRLWKIEAVVDRSMLHPEKKYDIDDPATDEIGLLAQCCVNLMDEVHNVRQTFCDNREYIEKLGQSVSISILRVRNNKVISANNSFLKLTGLLRIDIINRPVADVLHDSDISADVMSNIVLGRHSDSFNMTYNNVKRGKIPVHFRMEKIDDDESILLLNDMSESIDVDQRLESLYLELKRTNEQLTSAQIEKRNNEQVKNDIIGLVSGEFNTPLLSIIQHAKSLCDSHLSIEKHDEFVKKIIEETDLSSRLIENFLDMANIAAGGLEIVPKLLNLEDIIKKELKDINKIIEDKNLTVSYEPSPIQFTGDSKRFSYVIFNILHNAVKFSPDGGTISIFAEKTDNDINMFIRDEGPGVPEDCCDKVFDRLVVLKREKGVTGAGLGLPLAKSIIEAHKGKIWVENHPEGGLMVHFSVPIQVIA